MDGGFATLYADPGDGRRPQRRAGLHVARAAPARHRRPAAERTVAAVRDALRATTAFTAFDDLPVIQDPGGYPGKAISRSSRRS